MSGIGTAGRRLFAALSREQLLKNYAAFSQQVKAANAADKAFLAEKEAAESKDNIDHEINNNHALRGVCYDLHQKGKTAAHTAEASPATPFADGR